MLDGAATFLEKLPTFAFRSGLIVAIVGGALDLGLRSGVIDDGALGGYVAQIAPVLWVSGLAMVLGAVVVAALAWLSALGDAPRRWKERRLRSAKLVANLSFLDDQSMLILLLMLRLPMGRMEALQIPAFQRLQDLNLIVSESLGLVFGYAEPQGMMRVTDEIYSKRREVDQDLTRAIKQRYGIDASDNDALADLVKLEIENVRGNRYGVVYR